MSEATKHIDIVFDGPPSHESGRFIEVENELGQSISFGKWVERSDGWVLRIPSHAALVEAEIMTLRKVLTEARAELAEVASHFGACARYCNLCDSSAPRGSVAADDIQHKESCIITKIDAALPRGEK